MTRNCETIRQPQHQQRAFTLIEILVTIAIIVLLLGLLMVAISSLTQSTDARRTRSAMNIARAAVDEYFAQIHRYPEYDGVSNPDSDSIRHLVEVISKIPEAKAILMTIEDEFRIDDDDTELQVDMVVDAWGNPLQYRHFHNGGRAFNGSGNMKRHGTASEPKPFFASAGADGRFGTEDDIYSFELE